MKNKGIILAALVALYATACTNAETETTQEEVTSVTYSLDAASSTLNWKGQMSADYFHTGTVDITEGSVVMENGELTSGSFTIDMNTIKSTDLEDPKKSALEGHLMGTQPDERHPEDLFFHVTAFPTVAVTINDYTDGELSLTLDMLGKELTQKVKADVTSDEHSATIKGSFSLDLSSLEIPGLQPNEDGSQISPMIEFDLNVSLNK